MPNGQIFGYQLDSTADYQKAWANYNSLGELRHVEDRGLPAGVR